MKYTASRMSDGNKVFPAEIATEEQGLKVKIPGLFGGSTTHLDYTDISGVSVDTPLVGYSTIKFSTNGTNVIVHGFSKSDVQEIKQAIDEGKNNKGSIRSESVLKEESLEEKIYKDQKKKEKREREAQEKRYELIENIDQIEFKNTKDEIINEFDKLRSNIEKRIKEKNPDIELIDALLAKYNEGLRIYNRSHSQENLNNEFSVFEEKVNEERQVILLKHKSIVKNKLITTGILFIVSLFFFYKGGFFWILGIVVVYFIFFLNMKVIQQQFKKL